jgi:hypothetical protein
MTADRMVYQCEHCEMWQVDYSIADLLDTYGQIVFNDSGELGVSPQAMHEVINDVVREHLRDYHPWVLDSEPSP